MGGQRTARLLAGLAALLVAACTTGREPHRGTTSTTVGPLTSISMGDSASTPDLPFLRAGSAERNCDDPSSFAPGVLMHLRVVPAVIGSVICYVGTPGAPPGPAGASSEVEYIGVFYVPRGMSPLVQSGRDMIGGGGIEFDIKLNVKPFAPVPGQPPGHGGNVARVTVLGQRGFVQRLANNVSVVWSGPVPSGVPSEFHLFARYGYTADSVVHLAQSLEPGAPGPELSRSRASP